MYLKEMIRYYYWHTIADCMFKRELNKVRNGFGFVYSRKLVTVVDENHTSIKQYRFPFIDSSNADMYLDKYPLEPKFYDSHTANQLLDFLTIQIPSRRYILINARLYEYEKLIPSQIESHPYDLSDDINRAITELLFYNGIMISLEPIFKTYKKSYDLVI